MRVFKTKNDAAYWGGGIVAPHEGGYVSLHYTTGVVTPVVYTVAADGRYPGLVPGYVVATPEGGGPKCICEAG
jgi:hypothetical protein